MPRPIKCRKVGFIPENRGFSPYSNKNSDYVTLKIDEVEAIRLKDMLEYNQEKCAELMQISRQTFQNIIDSAHKKVASALINGSHIKIEGGNYIKGNCIFICNECGEQFEQQKSKDKVCPSCNSKNVLCNKKRKYCTKLK